MYEFARDGTRAVGATTVARRARQTRTRRARVARANARARGGSDDGAATRDATRRATRRDGDGTTARTNVRGTRGDAF